jgi:hypothetical protein
MRRTKARARSPQAAAATFQARIRDGVVGRATRAGRDPRRAVAGEASDAVDTCGLKGLGESHRRQDGGEPPGEHRRARPRGAEQEDIMGRTPASASACPKILGMPTDSDVHPFFKRKYRCEAPS